jgi:hypothetical protein
LSFDSDVKRRRWPESWIDGAARPEMAAVWCGDDGVEQRPEAE